MSLFTNAFIDEITSAVAAWHQELSTALGFATSSTAEANAVTTAPLRQQLSLLVEIANGELSRSLADKQTVQQVEAALNQILSLLLGNPLYDRAPFPTDFWQSDLGVLVSRVRWWLWADDLITISNAAALAFGENTQANRMKIVRAIDSGLLDWVPDPSVANPQQNRRVLRPQVERLGAQRRLPE